MKKYFLLVIISALVAMVMGGCGSSSKSNPAAPQTPSFAVTGLTATRTDSVTVHLSWNAVGSADTLYVRRGWGSATPTDTISRLSGAATSWIDSGVRTDSSYCYQVTARHDTATTSSAIVIVARYSTPVVLHYAVSVRPILNVCTTCHSPSGGTSGGWTVDGLTGAVNARTLSSYHGLGSLPIVAPGNPAGSDMYQRITSTGSLLMPQGGPALSSAQIQTIHDWIQEGANP